MSDSSAGWRAASAAAIEWVDGDYPRSSQFDDIYYSARSGLQESRHVFLEGGELTANWRDRQRFTVAELGFGSGLNFLVTWDGWRKDACSSDVLHYIAMEKFPLRIADLQRALSAWLPLEPLREQLLSQYPPPLPGLHRLLFEGGKLILDLHYEDALVAVTDLQEQPELAVDCWYMDGFAPARNRAMWTDELYRGMAQLSRQDTRLATFTAAGHVRRGLQAVGFAMEKVAGFGGKREMLRGHLRQLPAPGVPLRTPWQLAPSATPGDKSAAILGAGLAGASVASALANRGWDVTVFERGEVAGAASGNLQGVLYTRLSHRRSNLNEFSLHSFNFALRQYRRMMNSGRLQEGADGEFCGALHLLPDWQEQAQLQQTVNSLPELVRYLDQAEAQAISGMPGCPAGLFYPGAGWLRPRAVCAALLQQERITLQQQCGPVSLQADGQAWQVVDAAGKPLQRAGVVVVAGGIDTTALAPLNWLPLQSIRGQVTHIPCSGILQELRTVICHDGYIAPAVQGVHCVGATFELTEQATEPSVASHESNISSLTTALADCGLPPLPASDLPGRVGFRCASPDYLPLAGPVPDYAKFLGDFAALRKNARRVIDRRGAYYPGLYVSTGHGSRGLTSAPLCAELLAAQINGEPLPVSSDLQRALSPARFIVRDLIRNRV